MTLDEIYELDHVAAAAEFDRILKSLGIELQVSQDGLQTDEQGWRHDAWRCVLKDWRFPYKTGTGQRRYKRYGKFFRPTAQELGRPYTLHRERFDAQYLVPVRPTDASIFSSLVQDGEAIDMSFLDWCSEYGYSTDSLKALRTYEECCETGQRLRATFKRDTLEQLRALARQM